MKLFRAAALVGLFSGTVAAPLNLEAAGGLTLTLDPTTLAYSVSVSGKAWFDTKGEGAAGGLRLLRRRQGRHAGQGDEGGRHACKEHWL